MTLRLERKKTHYLVNYMLATGMIVILSWVGFWIDYRATPARCSLSITTVLTITTLTNSIRASLPQVGHIKSIDVYLLSCFFFVFASTIEFAITGVTDKKWLKLYESRRANGKVSKLCSNWQKLISQPKSAYWSRGYRVPSFIFSIGSNTKRY